MSVVVAVVRAQIAAAIEAARVKSRPDDWDEWHQRPEHGCEYGCCDACAADLAYEHAARIAREATS